MALSLTRGVVPFFCGGIVKYLLLIAAVIMTLLSITKTIFAAGDESNFLGIWMEGNYNPRYRINGAGTGTGGAFGIRSKYVGCRLGYIDNQQFNQSNISFLPAAFAQNATVNTGYKRVGGEYGGDVDFYLNLFRSLSLHAGPGLYYRGLTEVIREKYPDGTLSNGAYGGNRKMQYIPTGSAGLQVKLWHLQLGVGYHSERGYIASIGGQW
jgi:hypothetical protein